MVGSCQDVGKSTTLILVEWLRFNRFDYLLSELGNLLLKYRSWLRQFGDQGRDIPISGLDNAQDGPVMQRPRQIHQSR